LKLDWSFRDMEPNFLKELVCLALPVAVRGGIRVIVKT